MVTEAMTPLQIGRSASGRTGREVRLSSWGLFPVVQAHTERPQSTEEIAEILQSARFPSLIARGLGRSYGDAALNESGLTLLTEDTNAILSFDEQSGLMVCEAGTAVDAVVRSVLPRGWFPACTPGTSAVTIGGALCCDVHGKNHHVAGSFGDTVKSFRIMLASGEVVECSRDCRSDLFWATIGGMGLTGIVIDVTFQLQRVESAFVKVKAVQCRSLKETIEVFETMSPLYEYSFAWIEHTGGSDILRSVVHLGNVAGLEELEQAGIRDPFSIQRNWRASVPVIPPFPLVNKITSDLINELYWRSVSLSKHEKLTDCWSFFYPLDGLKNWNRLYGQRGFFQYQCAFPMAVSQEAIEALFALLDKLNIRPTLCAMKNFAPEHGLLSFPMHGYSVAFDAGATDSSLAALKEVDELVIAYGGRIYLAKDARLGPDAFRRMYKNFPRWLEVKSKVDPRGVFQSVLSERLKLF
ncbi:MAG TPA: FAD-binding oxidoreductase [Candidatus Obscuribacterales bacterium]